VSGYVLADFAKSEQHWLDDLMRGIADGAPELAAGRKDKFLNAVSLRTAPPRSSTSSPKARPSARTEEPPPDTSDPSPLQKLINKFR
ncbi:MAG: aminoacyl-tRNA hydrolase, partial [Pseudomonadota bacterium]